MADGPHYGAQTKARKAALDLLYAADLRGDGVIDLLNQTRLLSEAPVRTLTTAIVEGVVEHLATIDRRIAAALSGAWTLERMPAVDRALARIALFELDYTETPAQAVIAEAVRLAGDLSTDESPAFLNGLLAKAMATKPDDN